MIPALIGAAAGISGGMMGNKANEKARQQEYQQQKEFAQSGIQWKVQDAEKAGIHPLYALGANTVSYSPQSVGGPDYNFVGDAGQNIGRAIDATRSGPAKQVAAQITALQIEGLRLDNEFKRTQVASALATARQVSTPGLPSTGQVPIGPGIAGQGDTPQIDGPTINLTKKIGPVAPGKPESEYGFAPEIAWYEGKNQWMGPQIPQSLSESYENDTFGRWGWQIRNRGLPMISKDWYNPPYWTGREWQFNPFLGYKAKPRYRWVKPWYE